MSRTTSRYAAVDPTATDMAAVRAALDKARANTCIDLAELPEDAAEMVGRLLESYAAGHRPKVIPGDAEVSTFQAAGILNVSRPYLIKQLEAGALPFRMAGSHRRIRLQDVLTYKDKKDRESDAAMDELVAQAQELKLGY